MTTPIPVALIGFGFVGRTFHAPYLLATEGLELRVICSSQAEAIQQTLGGQARTLEVVTDPQIAAAHPEVELVVIASPNATHYPLAKAALEAGKHVVVDKPFTLDLAQARELAELARAHGAVLSVFQNRRWDSDFLAVREAIEAGTIGAVVELESRIDRFRPEVRDRWREQALPGSGLWFDLGPHLADQALELFGIPDEIEASIASLRPAAKTDDWAQVVLHYGPTAERGALKVTLHASMLVAVESPRFVVHGLEGGLIKRGADVQEDQLREGISPLEPSFGIDPDPLRRYDADGLVEERPAPTGRQRHYYELVRDAIAAGGDNPVPPRQAVVLMALLETATRAAEQGRRLPLELSDEERAAWA
ncbi:oxidoreductase [Halotalea alkalilenta]|uniref:Oxidoreductase n=1 Tax=Halotalea alkalilenta TaxID=376489 RepID=A0A172YID7_9GAMM|nr:oxidoreductase [Halotalea alkalilenta]ANF58805.1 oxidoreductase [Halotalea alkalilenta]